MNAHDALRHRRQYLALAEQQIGEADLGARIGDVVHCDEPVNLLLVLSGNASQAARKSANSVSPPFAGTRCA